MIYFLKHKFREHKKNTLISSSKKNISWMLALVTSHIFPPSIWYGKKWIPGTWLPGWQLAVFQSPWLHECGPADAHGNAQPFCMDKCIFHDWFPDALHTQTDRSTPPQSQQAEIDFLSLYVRKLSGKKIWAFFGMILYSWPHTMPRDPHTLSARFLENSVF